MQAGLARLGVGDAGRHTLVPYPRKMEIRRVTDGYAVSPQIEPQDVPAIAEAGYRTIICNRPDSEVPMELQSDVVRTAAEAAGLQFAFIPVTHGAMTPEIVGQQRTLIEEGPTLAYCASGTRSTIMWALGQAGEGREDEVIETAKRAGYDLSGLKGHLG